MQILVIIPARAGSKRVINKNLLQVDGVPLVVWAIDAVADAQKALKESGEDIFLRPIVSTDSEEIAGIANLAGAEVAGRSEAAAADGATVGRVVEELVADMGWLGPVMVIQPTSVPSPKQIEHLVRYWHPERSDLYYATVSARKGFYWRDGPDPKPLFGRRLNTQLLDSTLVEENGAMRLFPAGEENYYRMPDRLWTIPNVIDVDTWSDLQELRARETRGSIVFNVLASEEFGSGHLYRCMAIADELQGHEIIFASVLLESWAENILRERGYDVRGLGRIDTSYGRKVIVNDVLDTDRESVLRQASQGYRIVNFEDRGPGALYADAVINAMYPGAADREYNGPEWAIVRPEFTVQPWEHDPYNSTVMVMFGGTDPKDLTYQVADALAKDDYRLMVLTGPGYGGAYGGPTWEGSVASAMHASQLLITSGGRTVYEAALMGIPTAVIAQNLREVSHEHVGASRGNIYLGLADTVSMKQVRSTVSGLMRFSEPRKEMSVRSNRLVDGKGLRRVTRLIEDMIEGLR